MALRSPPNSKAIQKPGSTFQKLLKSPQVPFALALLFADAILVWLIIAYVPCKYQSISAIFTFILSSRFSNGGGFLFANFQIRRLIGTPTCHRWVDLWLLWTPFLLRMMWSFYFLTFNSCLFSLNTHVHIFHGEQVTGFLEGERDYGNLKGDTGPLVYPAGFLYIYSALQHVTRGQVYPAQVSLLPYS